MSTEAGSTKRGKVLCVKLRLSSTRDDELFPVRGAPKRVPVEVLRCKTISRRQRVRCFIYRHYQCAASVCGARAAAGVRRPPRYAIRPHTSAYRRCDSGPRETGHLGIWAGGTWGIENGPPGGTRRGGSCRAPDTVLLRRPPVQIPNRPEKCA